jgi:transcriptional antiterminator NusG
MIPEDESPKSDEPSSVDDGDVRSDELPKIVQQDDSAAQGVDAPVETHAETESGAVESSHETLDSDAPATDEKPKTKRRRSRKKAEGTDVGPKAPDENMQWYVLKVQSNREDSIADAIRRRLKIAALDYHVAEVIVPTEKVLEIKDGRKRVVKRKFYPGYLMARMEMTDDVWFTIRDTPGVGHFVGTGDRPLPMTPQDVERILGRTQVEIGEESETKEVAPRPAIDFAKGDRVVIKEGPFENFEGDVEEINEDKGKIRVVIQIFGRPTPVDVDYWQVGKIRL